MKEINRRSFLIKATLLGAGSILGENAMRRLFKSDSKDAWAYEGAPDIVSVKGEDYFASATKAVEVLGGMKSFVSKGDRVGLLVNSPFKNYGAFVNPDIVLAAIHMCREAGAKEIRYLKDPHSGYWKKTPLSKKYADLIQGLTFESGDYVKTEIAGARKLKDAKISKDLFDCDVFINISITKHHRGVLYTGALKNMMGLCPFSTNSYFHFGTFKLGWFKDIDHLSQCIADLNYVRTPDLCISDSTVFITDKGSYGPGPLEKPQLVVAASNRVHLDAYCCTLLGHKPQDILMIQKAVQHGFGGLDLDKLTIRAIDL